MIDPSEIPEGVGLKYCTEARATTIKKAAHREVVPPMELFCYILMARTRVVSSTFYEPETQDAKIERLKKWLQEKKENRRLGDILRFEIARHTDRVAEQNESLLKQVERWKFIAKVAQQVGIDKWDDEDSVRQKIADFKNIIPNKFIDQIKGFIREAHGVIGLLEDAKEFPKDYEI
jgi:hypothetical protein